MCGIVGLFGWDTFYNTHIKRNFLKDMLYIDALRGEESTGVAFIPTAKNHRPVVHKRALHAKDFIETKAFNRLLGNMDKTHGVIGHNRFATRGAITDETAHPFQYDHITLVHNGTVNNSEYLIDKSYGSADSPVDSAWVAWSFSNQEADLLLPKMTGAFSLVWWDARDASLHFARNAERPMYWYTNGDGKMIYFASELEMLWLAIQRNDVVIKSDVAHSTAPHFHYIFKDPKNVEVFEKRPFFVAKKKKKNNQVVVIPPTNGQTKNDSNSSPTVTGATSITMYKGNTAKESLLGPGYQVHPVETEQVSESIVDTIQQGIKERAEKLKMLVDKVNLTAFKTIVVEPRKWNSYKGDSKRGFVLCRHNGTNAIVQIFGISMGMWEKFAAIGRVPCRVINFRLSYDYDTYSPVFVAEFDNHMFDNIYAKWSAGQQTKESPIIDSEDMLEIGDKTPKYVTPQRYLKLTEDGCFNCGHSLSLGDAEKITWCGPEEEWPLCDGCGSNKDVVTIVEEQAKNANKH